MSAPTESGTMQISTGETPNCKKIINGKLYNTATSEKILTIYKGLRDSQRDYYVTKKGAFFVHYVQVNDIELVPDQTMASLLAYYDVDMYERFFGSVEEG